MRLTKLYQVFDVVAQMVSGPIFLEKRDAPAIRAFYGIFNHKGTLPADYPENFELRCVGVQDEETGQVTAECPPTMVASGTTWLNAQEPRATPTEDPSCR